jgi:transposase IS3/IS911 family protein
LEKLRAENKILRVENERAEMEVSFFKKTQQNIEDAKLSLVRHGQVYQAIKEELEEHGYPISVLCKLGSVSRAAYYKWLHREEPSYEATNTLLMKSKKFTWTALIRAIAEYKMIWNIITKSRQMINKCFGSVVRKGSTPRSSIPIMGVQDRR